MRLASPREPLNIALTGSIAILRLVHSPRSRVTHSHESRDVSVVKQTGSNDNCKVMSEVRNSQLYVGLLLPAISSELPFSFWISLNRKNMTAWRWNH